jgi:hypothetical protein
MPHDNISSETFSLFFLFNCQFFLGASTLSPIRTDFDFDTFHVTLFVRSTIALSQIYSEYVVQVKKKENMTKKNQIFLHI